ncbi:MAG: DMT family transporter [Candidatus Aminicenantes bacterium]|nr:DMT family transporter [Candidatus Aminicenantes bacterium]
MLNDIMRLPHIGEILSLVSAFVWALSVVLFRISGDKDKVHPLAMNLFKNWLALVLLTATVAVIGGEIPPLPLKTVGVFVLSGILGIALSDWLFFTALVKLGAELTAIVDCAYSPFVIILSFLFLGEHMTGLQIVGVMLIVGAVLLITRRKSDEKISRRNLLTGIGVGVVSMLLTAGGIVLAKPFLPGVSVLWATLIRMAGGAAAGTLLWGAHPRRREILRPLRPGPEYKILLPASFLSAYLSVLIWMAGMKYTQASIASALNQLNTIFIFILAALILKEKITPLKLAAVILAFAGAMLVSIPL